MDGELGFPGILAFLGVVVMGCISLMQIRKKQIGVCAPFLALEKARLGIYWKTR